MPRSYANIGLKSAPQKLNFVMTQSRSKIYTLDCSCKWLLALSHIVMHSLYVVFYKSHSIWNKLNILLARTIENYAKWMLDSERTLNKDKVTLDGFWNFHYVSSYFHLNSFAWKINCPISLKLQASRGWPRSF